jgi:hypothetical protein
MNDELHHLLDGELPDEATVDLLRSLVDDREKRALFREQMKLQGALYRNDGFASMSSNEEAEMLGRVSSAIGTGQAPMGRRFGSAVMATIIGALLVGGGLGFFADQVISGRASEPPPRIIRQEVPPPAVPTPPPCNCDSVAAAVRDSVARTATSVSPARKPQARVTRRSGIDDPTGRDAARRIAKKKKNAQQQ